MLTVILLLAGAIVIVAIAVLAMKSNFKSSRRGQSAPSVVTAQRQEKVRANSVRASGGDD
jgi:hypothetical protein